MNHVLNILYPSNSRCPPAHGLQVFSSAFYISGQPCVKSRGNSDVVCCRAHTCFKRLLLLPYLTPEILYVKLLLAVEETNNVVNLTLFKWIRDNVSRYNFGLHFLSDGMAFK